MTTIFNFLSVLKGWLLWWEWLCGSILWESGWCRIIACIWPLTHTSFCEVQMEIAPLLPPSSFSVHDFICLSIPLSKLFNEIMKLLRSLCLFVHDSIVPSFFFNFFGMICLLLHLHEISITLYYLLFPPQNILLNSFLSRIFQYSENKEGDKGWGWN